MELNYTVLTTVALSLLTLGWTVYQYMDARKRAQDLKEFENYHQLIKQLVQPENQTEVVMYIDRQAAIVFELRHFKRYWPISYRTLIGLREKWKKESIQYPRLLDECERTIEFLEGKKASKSWD